MSSPSQLLISISRVDAHLITGLLVAAATHRDADLREDEVNAIRTWWTLVMDEDAGQAERGLPEVERPT
ncbi:hypothetical protein [Ilumatobacter sp.]|uniref:hypothetical protein n=1 Tax=Ilumatobacter sp. TaxID=1967498 RepID=UPI003B525D9B